jgi:hypothetical protein
MVPVPSLFVLPAVTEHPETRPAFVNCAWLFGVVIGSSLYIGTIFPEYALA